MTQLVLCTASRVIRDRSTARSSCTPECTMNTETDLAMAKTSMIIKNKQQKLFPLIKFQLFISTWCGIYPSDNVTSKLRPTASDESKLVSRCRGSHYFASKEAPRNVTWFVLGLFLVCSSLEKCHWKLLDYLTSLDNEENLPVVQKAAITLDGFS